MPLCLSVAEYGFRVDLLLVSDEKTHHYVLILDFTKMTKLDHQPAKVKMPTEAAKHLIFKNIQARWFMPMVVYFDLESILKPVEGCQGPSDMSHSRLLQVHEPCGYALTVVEHFNDKPLFFKQERGPDCMQKFVKDLHILARDFYERKRAHIFFTGSVSDEDRDNKEAFDADNQIVLDHCHFSNKFLGWSHSQCNLARRTINFTPVIAHNLRNYDLHHVCLALSDCEVGTTIHVIPNTEEKFVSLSMGVFVKSFTNKRGVVVKVYEYLRFIDSLKFMNSSLEKLVDNMPRDKFKLLRNHFSNKSQEQIDLICKKGFYPYSYMSSFEKFNEETLPPLLSWKEALNDGEVETSEENYSHAQKVFTAFGCCNWGDYHDLYLSTDVLLLACVFEEFRAVCYNGYGLD